MPLSERLPGCTLYYLGEGLAAQWVHVSKASFTAPPPPLLQSLQEAGVSGDRRRWQLEAGWGLWG